MTWRTREVERFTQLIVDAGWVLEECMVVVNEDYPLGGFTLRMYYDPPSEENIL